MLEPESPGFQYQGFWTFGLFLLNLRNKTNE
ncbi:MAG: hypothetical protein JWR02_2000 [Mucilaginibacter sp.]|nr:hypothetical protein [Mucilaginibacter sp.]